MQTTFRPVALAATALYGALALWGQPAENPHTKKPPWEWTLEERIAARYDAEKMAERRNAYADALRSIGREDEAAAIEASPPTYQVLSGRENPEVFLPKHLFDSLLGTAFSIDRETRLMYRKVFTERSQGIRPDASFWRDISIIASGLLAMNHQVKEVFRELDSAQDTEDRAALEAHLPEIQQGRCKDLWEALQACRHHFGPEAFDRFLYEAVAPDQWVAGPLDARFDSPQATREKLAQERVDALFQELGGCPDDE